MQKKTRLRLQIARRRSGKEQGSSFRSHSPCQILFAFIFSYHTDLTLPNWADINEFFTKQLSIFRSRSVVFGNLRFRGSKNGWPLVPPIETPPKIKLICLLTCAAHTGRRTQRFHCLSKTLAGFSNASSSVTLMQFFQRLANGKQTKDTLYNGY